MSEQLHKNRKPLASASVVSVQAGYTTDYVTKLARDGKITGEKIGRQWYVDPGEVLRYARQAKKAHLARKKELRAERKAEYRAHTKSDTEHSVFQAKGKRPLLVADREQLVPAPIAALRAGYSTDYITKLAREGKIAALKIGRQWYVDLATVKTFAQQTERELVLRSTQLRGERKTELNVRREILLPEKSFYEYFPGRSLAAAQASLVLLFCLTLGAFSYYQPSGTELAQIGSTQMSALKEVSVSFYRFITPESHFFAEGENSSLGLSDSSQTKRSYDVAMLPDVVDGKVVNAKRIVGDAFSDSVNVQFDTEVSDSGVITPRFEEGGDSEYRFRLLLEEMTPKAQGG